jgi:hypothetical protein
MQEFNTVTLQNPNPSFLETSYNWVINHIPKLSADALGLIAIVLCHLAAVPTLVAVLLGQSDKLPPVDIMVFVWAALILMFIKALIDNKRLYIATITLGFAATTILMGLILFK